MKTGFLRNRVGLDDLKLFREKKLRFVCLLHGKCVILQPLNKKIQERNEEFEQYPDFDSTA
jgi:hypothetical protein